MIFLTNFLVLELIIESYRRDVTIVAHVNKFFGNKRLSEITPEDVERYKSQRKGVKNGTINRELACFKRMFNLAMKWGDAPSNPVTAVRFLHEPPKKERYVTREEAAKLMQAAPDYFKAILTTAFNTGMRLQEILSLKWEQVKLWDKGGEIELIYTKNGKKRYVPLNEEMRNLLRS